VNARLLAQAAGIAEPGVFNFEPLERLTGLWWLRRARIPRCHPPDNPLLVQDTETPRETERETLTQPRPAPSPPSRLSGRGGVGI
jgi:hypothetical protein